MNMMMNMRKNMLCRKGEYDDDCEEECIRENANMRTNMHQRKGDYEEEDASEEN